MAHRRDNANYCRFPCGGGRDSRARDQRRRRKALPGRRPGAVRHWRAAPRSGVGSRTRNWRDAAGPPIKDAAPRQQASGIWLSAALTASASCRRLRLLNRKRACKPKRAEQGTKMSGQAAAGHATRWHDPPSARSRQNPRRAPEPPSLIRELAIHGLEVARRSSRPGSFRRNQANGACRMRPSSRSLRRAS